VKRDDEFLVDEEVADVTMGRPHLILLGAGASRATCPNGDKNGRVLPLMLDFTEVLDIKSLLRSWGLDPDRNFEDIFSELYENSDISKIDEIQSRIESYFSELELPNYPTVYDHLVLSLRDNDVIATFNWIHCYCKHGSGM